MKVLFSLFIFFSPFSLSFSLPKKNVIVAQEESLFDDSDLADIEGVEADEGAEDELDTFDEEGVDSNFDEEDFEIIDEEMEEEFEEGEEVEEEKSAIDEEEDEFDDEEYEIVSDRPGYEIISDEELEEKFEEGPVDEGEEEESDVLDEEPKSEDTDEDKDEVLEDLEESDEEEDFEVVDEEEEEEPDVLDEEPKSEDKDEVLEDLEESDEEEDFEVIDEEEEEEPDVLDEEPKSEDTDKDEVLEDLEESGEEEDKEELEDDLVIEEEIELEKDSVAEEALNLITNIRYLASEDQIVIDCSEPSSYQVRTNEETNQFIIEILQAKLADNLHWPYVLRDFDTDFGLIKADQKDSSTVRIIIQLKEGADFPKSTLTEDGDQILIGYGDVINYKIIKQGGDSLSDSSSILPAKTLEDLYFGEVQFSGTPISFHVMDAPVKQVLRFISEESGLNMVIGERVEGNVNLKLEDVPWDQALYAIFQIKSLGYTRDGNVITILPLEEIEERTKKLKEISDRQKSLSPYETKVIPINYGKISEIESKVKEFSTPASEFTKAGKIIVHPESNTFVVIDTPEVVKKIESLVRYLDKPPKQVMVEAKIVEVAENFTKNFGLNWGLGGNLPVSIGVSGVLELFQNMSGSYGGQIREGSGTAALNISGLPIIGDIGASLNLAESDGQAQIISTPKVVVISGKTASMTRNTPILIPTSTTTTTTPGGDTSTQESLQTSDVSISLNVTPTVTTTGSVFLQVDVTRSDPGGRGGAFKTQRTAKTEVLVKNGQTIVIGGIYEQDEVKTNAGLPFLKSIPFFNMLFNTIGKNSSKAELLVFITPKLLDSHE